MYETLPGDRNPEVTINCIPRLMFCVCVDCTSRHTGSIVNKKLFVLINNKYTCIDYTPSLGDYNESNISTSTGPFEIAINNNSIEVVCASRSSSNSSQVCLGVLYIE